MSADRAELYRLILGRTATAAVEAILAAGFERPKQYERQEWERCAKGPHSQAAHLLDCDPIVVIDLLHVAGFRKGTPVIVTPCDPEAYARGHNDGFDVAVAQGLADDPTLADDWLQTKLQEARIEALEEAAKELDRRITELRAEQ